MANIIFPKKTAVRAKAAITMAGEKAACGKSLFQTPAILDNPLIIIENGIITYVGCANHKLAAGYEILDFGERFIIPPVVNAHAHLQLSWLKGKLKYHAGFTPWLKSLVPHIINDKPGALAGYFRQPLQDALAEIASSGAKYVGDIGGSLPGAATAVLEGARAFNLHINLFCEWFGFSADMENMPWPDRCRVEILRNKAFQANCSPAGHALYSTKLQILQRAKQWCEKSGRIFSMHLAESEDENALLVDGAGPLYDFYFGKVLPDSWKPYGMRPCALAERLGLLDAHTLAAHGVTLNDSEAALFTQSGAVLCLCPRSNHQLNVGNAPFAKYFHFGTRLCLGTDGLTSNTDLDVRNEAVYLKKNFDVPKAALWKMLTVNGADALGLPVECCQILPGKTACFSILPPELE